MDEFTPSQLIKWLFLLPTLFAKHNQIGLLLDALKAGLSRCYKSIPNALLQEMLQSLPTDDALDIKDNISQNGDDDDDDAVHPIMNLLSMPHDLKLLCFNFLTERDLYSAQKTCRCLLIAARDPNALYHLKMRWRHSDAYLTNPFFSRIRSLNLSERVVLSRHFPNPNVRIEMNPKWASTVTRLEGDENYTPSFACSSDAFRNLRTCRMRRAFVMLLDTPCIDCATLRVLEVSNWTLCESFLSSLSECVCLERLSLSDMSLTRTVDAVSSFIGKPFPLCKLSFLRIDAALLVRGDFIDFLLANGVCKKRLEIFQLRNNTIADTMLNSAFSITSRHGLSALTNVDSMDFDLFCHQHTKRLLMNIAESTQSVNRSKFGSECKRFRAFTVAFKGRTANDFDEGLLQSLLSITPFCEKSSLTAYVPMESASHAYFAEWVQRMVTSAVAVFTEIHLQLFDDEYLVHPLCEFILANASNKRAIEQRAAQMGCALMKQYRKWIVRRRCTARIRD